jgi:hypothetical protein
MGFLKKITRPISRALDKIIPNEVKPALPFLAAAAPFMAPGLMGLGGTSMLSKSFNVWWFKPWCTTCTRRK